MFISYLGFGVPSVFLGFLADAFGILIALGIFGAIVTFLSIWLAWKLKYQHKSLLINVLQMNDKFKLWLKRVGVGGFLFFLIKGLVWCYVFYAAGKCASQ